MLNQEVLLKLQEPFPAGAIKVKMQTQPKEGDTGRALCVAYIDARDVMERLDEVVQGEWQDAYAPGINGGVECRLTIHDITRCDVGVADENEKEKSAYSDAFKRAAVKFGVGRFLYDLPKMYANVTKNGKYWNMDRGEVDRLQNEIQAYLGKQKARATKAMVEEGEEVGGVERVQGAVIKVGSDKDEKPEKEYDYLRGEVVDAVMAANNISKEEAIRAIISAFPNRGRTTISNALKLTKKEG